MNILIIGTGNVAAQLLQGFSAAPGVALFLHGRNPLHLDEWKTAFPSVRIMKEHRLSAEPLDLILIAVKDDVLQQVYEQYTFPAQALVAHTSGSQSIHQPDGKPVAVFYPLQTFSKLTPVDWKRVPLLLEADSEKAYDRLQEAAHKLGAPAFETDEKQRNLIHLAAVLACNFSNHLIGKAASLLKEQQIDYHLLQPLMEETLRKAFLHDPFSVQTGPAVRGDQGTIEKQQQELQTDPLLQKIYTDMTESIQKTSTFTSGKKYIT